jgi:hypothetical protein
LPTLCMHWSGRLNILKYKMTYISSARKKANNIFTFCSFAIGFLAK